MVSNQYAEAAAVRAVYTGQLIWHQHALRLCKSDVGLLEGLTRRQVSWAGAGAVVNGDLDAALEALGDDSAGDALALLPVDLLRGATQAALGKWAGAHVSAEIADAAVRKIPVPAPALHAAMLRSRIAAANGDLPMADPKAHESLATAFDAGLRVATIDTLETVAAVTPDRVRAARLAGAASADRLRCGYVARLWSGLAESDAVMLQTEQPDAWSEGGALTMAEAAPLADADRIADRRGADSRPNQPAGRG